MTHYVYVLVRTDIPLPQQLVQVGHACLEAAWKFERPAGNLAESLKDGPPVHLCLQSVSSEQELFEAYERAQDKGIQAYMFYEPDLPGYTAFATQPIPADLQSRRAIFKKPMWEAPTHVVTVERQPCEVKHDPTRNLKYITGDKTK